MNRKKPPVVNCGYIECSHCGKRLLTSKEPLTADSNTGADYRIRCTALDDYIGSYWSPGCGLWTHYIDYGKLTQGE